MNTYAHDEISVATSIHTYSYQTYAHEKNTGWEDENSTHVIIRLSEIKTEENSISPPHNWRLLLKKVAILHCYCTN